jgi:uncharacterized protein YdeI (YjbR/CyaY-like superfamily)
MNPGVDAFLKKAVKWRKELEQLREIILECDLVEEMKWGQPCYSFNKKNICIIGELKNCAVMGFFKGALLKDTKGILLKPGENTRSARSIEFTGVKEITKLRSTLKSYIYEAIEIEEAGLKVEPPKSKDLDIPEELETRFNRNAAFKKAFYALTPGRQRAYVLHFSSAKQPATREARIEKYTPQIMDGVGLNDEYNSEKK